MKRKHWTLTPWFLIFAMAMLMMTMATYSYNKILCYIELGITVGAFTIVIVLSLRFQNYIKGIVKSTAEKINHLYYPHRALCITQFEKKQLIVILI